MLRVCVLVGAGMGEHLQVDHVEPHETEGETSKDTAEHDEGGDGEDVEGELEWIVADGVVLLVIVSCGF